MPSYPWFFDEDKRPNERGLALIAYVQWLGSWAREVPMNVYNMDVMREEAR
jgi:hypothetical protein